MRVVSMTAGQLGGAIKRDAVEFPREIAAGINAAALRGQGHLASGSRVYTGQMKASWRVEKTSRGFDLVNMAPHAGIEEAGSRPHTVDAEGREALERWAELKLGLDPRSAAALAAGYIKRLEQYGSQGTFQVRDAQDDLARFLRTEVERQLGKHHDRGVG